MIVLKLLVAPFVVVLTLFAAVASLLFCVAGSLCVVSCVVLTLLAVVMFIDDQTLDAWCSLCWQFLFLPTSSR